MGKGAVDIETMNQSSKKQFRRHRTIISWDNQDSYSLQRVKNCNCNTGKTLLTDIIRLRNQMRERQVPMIGGRHWVNIGKGLLEDILLRMREDVKIPNERI